MTPEEIRLTEQLKQTELALEEATSNVEISRSAMREIIMEWRKEGWSWKQIKSKNLWKAFVRIGGS
jgi:hypothetical protein